MPCITDEPNRNQVATQRAAKLLAYVNEAVGRDTPHWVTDLAGNAYAVDGRVIPMLCETLREMDPSVRDGIVYNPRNRTARDLASWWEDHQEADRKREKTEKGHAFRSVPSLEASLRLAAAAPELLAALQAVLASNCQQPAIGAAWAAAHAAIDKATKP